MYHEVASYPGTPDSATVGTSGIEFTRFGEVTAISAYLPCLDLGDHREHRVDVEMRAAADEVGHRAAGALVWDVGHLHPGHAHEHLGGEMRCGSGTGVAALNSSGLALASAIRSLTFFTGSAFVTVTA